MNKEDSNLFGVYVDRVNSGIFEFANKSEYSLLPIVSIVRNDDIPVIVRTNKPMKLFKKGTSYSFIKGMLRNENNSVLSIPWMAFRDIQEIAREKSNKVLADLVAAIIVEKSKECIEKNEKSKSIFFIESTDSRKIIGRLGNLYLDPQRIIVVFLTYKAGGLMTDMLTNRKEQLFFDIDFFKNSKKEKSDIIPNDYRESLTQTVFFNMTKEKDKEMSPIRCEILSQGLTSLEIKNNVECIYNILSDNDKLTPPFPINNDDRDSAPYTRIPKVLKSAEMAFEANKKIVKNEVGII